MSHLGSCLSILFVSRNGKKLQVVVCTADVSSTLSNFNSASSAVRGRLLSVSAAKKMEASKRKREATTEVEEHAAPRKVSRKKKYRYECSADGCMPSKEEYALSMVQELNTNDAAAKDAQTLL